MRARPDVDGLRTERDAHPDRHRRLGAAGQRRRHDDHEHRPRAASARPRGRLVTPEGFRTLPLSDLSGDPPRRCAAAARVGRMVDEFEPDAVHIATEAPLGLAVRRHCLRARLAVHDRVSTRSFPNTSTRAAGCRSASPIAGCAGFTARRSAVMVPTPEIHRRLAARGFANLAYWSRGVDTELFAPAPREAPAEPAADLPLRRPRRGREEHRGVSAARSAGNEMGRRRRPGARRARGDGSPTPSSTG